MFFCINILIFQVLLWWESASLKSSYTCIYVLYIHIHAQICVFVCKLIYANAIFFPSIVQAEVLPAPYAQTLMRPGSLVFHSAQGAAGLPSPLTPCAQRTVLADPPESVTSGHSRVPGLMGSAPSLFRPTLSFLYQVCPVVKAPKRSTGVVLDLCPSPELQQSLKKCFWRPLRVCFSNRTSRSHS